MHKKKTLSKRERQIMDIVYELGEASAETIRQRLPDAPKNGSVRVLLRILHEKGELAIHKEGRKYIYKPATPIEAIRNSVLERLIRTFFDNSPAKAAVAMFNMNKDSFEDATLDELQALINAARNQQRDDHE